MLLPAVFMALGLLLAPVQAYLYVTQASDAYLEGTYQAPLYVSGVTQGVNITNATLVFLPSGASCSNIIPDPPTFPAILFSVVPLCYPEVLAERAALAKYSALIVANGIAPGPGLWARSFWKKKPKGPIPIADFHVNLSKKNYLKAQIVSLDSLGTNYFHEYAQSPGFIFLLVLAHLCTLYQLLLAAHRIRFNWINGGSSSGKMKNSSRFSVISKLNNVAAVISILHFFSAIFRHVVLGDPFGVLGNYSFPLTNWMVFFATTFSEVATFVLGFSFHRILAKIEEDFQEGNLSNELVLVAAMSAIAVVVNVVLTLLNSIAGFPDSFFLVLNMYGLLQIYMGWYFMSKRSQVLMQENNNSQTTKRGYREYQMNRSMRLLQGGLIVNVLYVILFQPVGLAVLKFGACASGNCSSLLGLLVLSQIFMNLSSILQLLSLPGETRAQWNERMGGRIVSGENNTGTQGPSSRVVAAGDVEVAAPSVSMVSAAGMSRTQQD